MKPVTITVATKKKDQVVDITETLETHLRNRPETDGVCVVFVAHTTCSLTTADLDPGTAQALLNVLRHRLPSLSYRQPPDPFHPPDRLPASIIGPSVTIPYHNRKLLLGTWQRVILVELD